MDFQLLIVRGRGASTTVKLADGVTTVGRQDDCQLRIKSSQVSRKHCELFEKKGLLLVKDLGSSNGTFVNGKRIQEQRVLEPGDELTIGQLLFKVAKVGQAPPKTPAAAAVKPGDTAVVEAIPAAEDDEFEIEFDVDVPSPETIPTVAEVDSAPVTPEPEPKTEPKSKSEETPQPVSPAEPDKLFGDDAIADFLLDIKFDED
ncbi:FHA domain-containing protein [Singulisphaera acidiphila]|uniref:FHA domain-containing protein n=1 Tax=Singulisphaera acidiphila (strain ATCC BAA-1392 / DSM 18658 / VKM B-2454 / MOB10) TaxID=886293 RepID=L0DDH8_SINAD|nr:FHA domain-containing protein [Singulisphaera acidiphila]AGA26873.1 FHA domain-containing protein [Singulisphaera acidiphila DSM 18658]